VAYVDSFFWMRLLPSRDALQLVTPSLRQTAFATLNASVNDNLVAKSANATIKVKEAETMRRLCVTDARATINNDDKHELSPPYRFALLAVS